MSQKPSSQPPSCEEPPQVVFPAATNSKSPITIVILIILGVMAIPCAGILVALIVPALQVDREGARRLSCSNNLRQISMAIYLYESTYRKLPPAFTVDSDGRPLHSWRTLILPFMECGSLYERIDLSKPWDDPVNLAIGQFEMPLYSCPSNPMRQPGLTVYQLVEDPRAAIFGSETRSMAEISDGPSNTLIVVECSEADAVPWMKPQDLPMSKFLSPSGRYPHSGSRHVAMADISVRLLPKDIDPESAVALVTRAGGEQVGETEAGR